MIRYLTARGAALPILCVLAFFTGCSENEEPIPVTTEMLLQEVIDEKIGEEGEKLVGVSVSIRVGEEERWNLVGGHSALGEPVRSDMIFGIGSVTKTVVAATVMKLIDEGILTLDDTIGDWLALDLPNVDNDITIRQLLSHFTGLNGYMFSELWDRAESDPSTPIPNSDLVTFIGEPYNTPGVEHQYSNSNYLLLGMIIEASTGKTVGEVMRGKFWSPLNLTNMYFGTNEAIPEPIATPWRDSDGDGTLEDIKATYGPSFHSIFYCAADVFSTASDLSMWAQYLYNGDAVSRSSQIAMMSSYVDIPHQVFTGYSYGTRRNVYAGRTMWGHTGGMRGYGSHMFFDPRDKVSIAILNNQSRSEDGPELRQELIDELLEIVFEALREEGSAAG